MYRESRRQEKIRQAKKKVYILTDTETLFSLEGKKEEEKKNQHKTHKILRAYVQGG